MLAACGGDDGGSTPTPTPTPNQAPRFTSASAVNVANGQTAAYQATATDPEGAALTFSISGGADRARFAINSQGALTFTSPPDFNAPGDADRNNIYLVQLSVSDGQASATLDLQVTVANGQTAFAVRRVATGLNQPLFVAAIPGDPSRVFVLEKGGRILLLNPANQTTSLFMDVSAGLSTDGERGLLGIAPQPDYATSGVFFIFVTNAGGDIEIRRYVRGSDGFGSVSSGVVVLTIEHSAQNNHNGGWMAFDPSFNKLFIAVGDGGGAGDNNGNAQNRNTQLGKILRYNAVPNPPYLTNTSENPFGGQGGVQETIYALGLRNPFRASFDRPGGNSGPSALYIGDVGENAIEEINLLPEGGGGANFGWAYKEGTSLYANRTVPSGVTVTDPVTEYSHGTGPRQGASVIGGYVYRGPVASLVGQYIFGDFISGNLWSVPASSLVAARASGQTVNSSNYTLRNADFRPNAGTIDRLVSFGVDGAGNLYIVDLDGDIFALQPA